MSLLRPVPLLLTFILGQFVLGSACIVVNIHGSIDTDILAGCFGESAPSSDDNKDLAYLETRKQKRRERSAIRNVESHEPYNETNESHARSTLIEEDPIILAPEVRRLLCVFVSGFLFAAGLFVILNFDKTSKQWTSRRRPQLPPSSSTTQSSSEDAGRESSENSRVSSDRAVFGSSREDRPPPGCSRSCGDLWSRPQDHPPGVAQNRPPEVHFGPRRHHQLPGGDGLRQANSCPSRMHHGSNEPLLEPNNNYLVQGAAGGSAGLQSDVSPRTQWETVHTSTPASSVVELGQEEHWL